jgi:hypothetical protein
MNDVLRTLREARPAELNPDAPVDPRVREAELARAMVAAPAADRTPARRRRRPLWAAGGASAVAAGALVAGAFVAFVPSGGDGPEPGGSTRPLDARTVLLAAAEKADGRADAGSGAYWHTVSIASHTYTVKDGAARYTVTVRDRQETWTPGEPGGVMYSRHRDLGATPATAADAAAWRRAGSPDTVQVGQPIAPGSGIVKPRRVRFAPSAPSPLSASRLDGGGEVYWLGRNVTVRDLRALPSDPKRLRTWLLRWYKGHDTESGRPMGADEWLYRVARGMVLSMPVRPEVRAAGFRMLAELPSVTSVGAVTDGQGRPGNAIAMDDRTDGGVIRDQLIIDLGTGTALASGIIMVKPAPGTDVPAGRTMSSEVVLTAGWTNSTPR